jgi:hypothetical protein
MKGIITIVSLLFFLSCLVVPACAEEEMVSPATYEEPTGAEMIADLVLVRPVSMAATIIGAAFSIPALPFGLATGHTKEMYEKLVVEPYKYTVCRPLGTGF